MDKKAIRKQFNSAVLARDGRCLVCGATAGLNVHHIIDRHDLPNGSVPENGITLCETTCHMKAEKWHRSGGKEHEPGFHPDDLYRLIGSSCEKAKEASLRLGQDQQAVAFRVEVERKGSRRRKFHVEAFDEQEAKDKALKRAGEEVFHVEHAATYEIVSVEKL